MIELLLTIKDFFLNLLTGGKWSEYQGDRRDYVVKE